MKALIYSTITLVTLVVGMQCASNMASSVSESVETNTTTRIEQQLQQYK